MTDQTPTPTTIQKLSTIWSSRRNLNITVAVTYQLREENGCKIYKLNQIQELDNR